METKKNLYSQNKYLILFRYSVFLIALAILAIIISIKLFNNTVIEADNWRNHSNFNKVENHKVRSNFFN